VLTPHPQPFAPPSGAPAGWYPDPYGGPWARYWDGRRWTPYTTTPRARSLAPPTEHPVLPLRVMVGAMVVLFVSLVAQREMIDRIVEHNWPVFVYMGLSVLVGYGPSVVWLWFASRRWGTGDVAADLGIRFRWHDLGWGPLIWLCMAVNTGIAVALIRVFDIPYRSNLDIDGQTIFSPERTAVASLVLSSVVFAPVIEEPIFRGAVMRGLLSKTHAVVAITIQGVLFGAVHFDPDYGIHGIGLVIALSVAGIGLGVACYLLRRLGPVIIAHAVMNSVAMMVAISRWY
jgi:uncharacterized protein